MLKINLFPLYLNLEGAKLVYLKGRKDKILHSPPLYKIYGARNKTNFPSPSLLFIFYEDLWC